ESTAFCCAAARVKNPPAAFVCCASDTLFDQLMRALNERRGLESHVDSAADAPASGLDRPRLLIPNSNNYNVIGSIQRAATVARSGRELIRFRRCAHRMATPRLE